MSQSPTALSLNQLRKDGWQCQVVEKTLPKTFIKQDLFGFIDILAVRDGVTMGVQATDYTSVSKRVNKIALLDTVDAVRKAGWKLVVWGWHKVGNRWTYREVDVS